MRGCWPRTASSQVPSGCSRGFCELVGRSSWNSFLGTIGSAEASSEGSNRIGYERAPPPLRQRSRRISRIPGPYLLVCRSFRARNCVSCDGDAWCNCGCWYGGSRLLLLRPSPRSPRSWPIYIANEFNTDSTTSVRLWAGSRAKPQAKRTAWTHALPYSKLKLKSKI